MNRPATLAVVAVAGVAALAVGVGGWTNGGTQDKKQSFEQKITEIRLDTHSGDVEVTAGDVNEVQVEQRYQRFWVFPAKPKKLEVDGETLVLPDGSCGWNCSVDYIVRVPANTKISGRTHSGSVSLQDVASVDLRVDSGDVDVANADGSVSVESASGTVEVEQVRGDLTVHSQSGDITADDVSGKSELTANSGSINADNLRAAVNAETSSGDISVDLSAPASVRATASSGDVNLRVPGGPYKVVAETSSGDVEGTIDSDPKAGNTLEARTSSGDVSIERD